MKNVERKDPPKGMKRNYEVRVVWDEMTETYSVLLEGETSLECMGPEEMRDVSLLEVLNPYV